MMLNRRIVCIWLLLLCCLSACDSPTASSVAAYPLASPISMGTETLNTRTLPMDTPTITPLSSPAPDPPIHCPAPTLALPDAPAAGHVIYVCRRGVQTGDAVWRVALDGSDNHQLFALPPRSSISQLSIAPDHTQLAYTVATISAAPPATPPTEPPVRTTLHVRAVDGTQDRVVFTGWAELFDDAFSPDGTQLGFIARSSPSTYIGVIPLTSGQPRQVVPSLSSRVEHAAWLNDEQLIVTMSPPNLFSSSVRWLFRASAAGDAPLALLGEAQWWAVNPAHTRALVEWQSAVRDPQAAPFAIVALDTNLPQVLREVQRPDSGFMYPPLAWAPDDSGIAYVTNNTLSMFRLDTGRSAVVLRADDTERREGSVRWDSTGTGVIYQSLSPDGTVAIQRYTFADQHEHTVVRFANRENTVPFVVAP